MSRTLVTLRSAVPSDAADLVEVWSDVIRRAGAEDQVADIETVIKDVDASPDRRIVVAEYDGEFAGAVLLEATTISPINLEPVVRALSPHVLPRFRRRGVGCALMDAAVTWAEERGIAHVATAAVSESRDANRFMARLALGPYAVLRVAHVPAVRARLTAVRRPARGNGRQVTQVIAARRSLRRSRARAAETGR